MTRRRVLVAHPSLNGDGGADQVAAWTLQALCDDFDVTLLTAGVPVDFERVDAFCETALADSGIEVRVALPAMQSLLNRSPMRLALLRIALMLRDLRRFERRERFDCVVSTFNEMDFGRPGIQYVHFPWSAVPRPEWERRWFNRSALAVRAYHAAVRAVGGISREGMRANTCIANSRFVADHVERTLGVDCTVVSPPVPGRYSPPPWSERRQEMICVGRISPEKRIDEVIEIVRQVRDRGHPLGLRIFGLPEAPAYVNKLQNTARTLGDWVAIEIGVPRERLREAMQSARFGIHAMRDEHFGIAIGEMLRAGCVTFAHDSGGPAEILDGEEDLLFGDLDDAVAKISRVLTSEENIEALRSRLAERAASFTTERFTEAIRDAVHRFIDRRRSTATPS
jgi:glycosyltransferase involved in cell wall biosynthesis